ncbi:glycosyltransferase [Vibrio diabolicus]|uniref:glycosyltransferase n=1 Tax=Vibrio diabolicus TaxID=50719 RepID=UPI003F84BECC
MKICFFIPGFSNGGAQKQCIKLLNQLSLNYELEIHLMYFYEGISFHELNLERINLNKLNFISFYDPRNIMYANRMVREIQPNILFSWLHSCDVYSYFVKKLNPEIKWVMAERDSYYPDQIKYNIRCLLGKKSDLIIANSNKGKKYWKGLGVDEKKIIVVENILSEALEYDANVVIDNRTTIAFAGRFEDQKNILLTTKLFCKLSVEFPDYRFLLIGEGSRLAEVSDLIKNTRVEIVPYQKNIISLFNSIDVFVNLSKHEGKPNTVIENIACKSIVVVSDIEEHREILGDEYNFYIDTSRHENDIFFEISELISKLNDFVYDTDYKYAHQVLKKMLPQRVCKDYTDIFMSL